MEKYLYNPQTGELLHYGVKGMKWRKRLARAINNSAAKNRLAGRRAVTDAQKRSQGRIYDFKRGVGRQHQLAYNMFVGGIKRPKAFATPLGRRNRDKNAMANYSRKAKASAEYLKSRGESKEKAKKWLESVSVNNGRKEWEVKKKNFKDEKKASKKQKKLNRRAAVKNKIAKIIGG